MIIYKGATFSDWSRKYCISDEMLISAVNEMNRGVYEANLGGYVYKKRIAIGNKGKSAGVRTILAFIVNEKAFFIYGFAKNKLDNINDNELKALKKLAKIYVQLTQSELNKAVQERKLIRARS